MNKKQPKKILVVRFRQMGDTILATSMLNTLHKNFPNCTIDLVLNERIAPLFYGHPSISNLITFTEDERHKPFTYIKKVWNIVHYTHYDVIIDMRSTINTMLFALFSPKSHFRIGLKKIYTWIAFTHSFPKCRGDESMIDHNLKLISPLSVYGKLTYERHFTLHISNEEKKSFRIYMEQQGINFSRPIILIGVTARLNNKTWQEDRMIETLAKLINKYPDLQLIFNYAPGKEAENARRIYEKLGRMNNIFINIEAKNARQMASMAYNCTAYFGNEGGARHIVHAMGRPSFVICAPTSSRITWIPKDDIVAEAIDPHDQISENIYATLTHQQRYDLITIDMVWKQLDIFIKNNVIQ